MKFFTVLICFYLILLTGLPSVRAIKLLSTNECKSSSQSKANLPFECEKSKFVMTLNFSPVQFIATQFIQNTTINQAFETKKEEKLNYKNNNITNYPNSIWQPPENIFLI